MTDTFQRGDKVTVTLEGEVTGIIPFDDRVELRVTDDSGANYYIVPGSENVTKVEPPVEVFGPGSVVREITGGRGAVWAVGATGYMRLDGGSREFYRSGTKFTSEHYELVDLS